MQRKAHLFLFFVEWLQVSTFLVMFSAMQYLLGHSLAHTVYPCEFFSVWSISDPTAPKQYTFIRRTYNVNAPHGAVKQTYRRRQRVFWHYLFKRPCRLWRDLIENVCFKTRQLVGLLLDWRLQGAELKCLHYLSAVFPVQRTKPGGWQNNA